MKNGFMKIGVVAVLIWAVLVIAGCPKGAQKPAGGGGSSDTSGVPIKPGN